MFNHGPVILIVFAGLLGGCDKSHADDQPSSTVVTNTNANAGVSAGVKSAESITTARNASVVMRFSDEVPMPATPSKLISGPTRLRTTPYGGDVVTVFSNGESVTELAKKGDWYLVICSDPNDATQSLAGWIYKDAIVGATAKSDGRAANFPCKTGEVHVLSGGLCVVACTHDGDCAAVGGVCDGNGEVSLGTGVSHAQYCVAPSPRP